MKAKTGTVTVYMPAYKVAPDRGRVPVQLALPKARPVVPATIIAGLALHRSVGRDGTEESPARWTLTHVASGASVNSLLPLGRPRDGKASRAAYVAFLKNLATLEVYQAWERIMSTAPFGTGTPSAMGGRCVDLSRELAARAREIGPVHFGTAREL
jgi:hypothetical protein